jgi:hypothetical protein
MATPYSRRYGSSSVETGAVGFCDPTAGPSSTGRSAALCCPVAKQVFDHLAFALPLLVVEI